nr:YihY/virulence factor BrkB family protein [Oculatella sp. LEGE 06141]
MLKETVTEWSEDNASRLAAALAYYTVFSLAPLLIIVIAVAGFFFGEEAARGQIVGQIQGLVGQDGAEIIQTAIDNANQPGTGTGAIASLISIGVLLFGASGVFAELQDSLNAIWNVKAKPKNAVGGFVRKRLLSFTMVLTIGFLLLVSLVVSAALTALTTLMNGLMPGFDFLWQLLNFVISFGVIALLFALIYKYLPDVKITWNDVLIGASMTALLFTIGKSLIGLYLGNSSFGSAYGAAGSLVVVLAWVYYSAQILFFGAEFTQVYARHYGSQIVPDEHAVYADDSTEQPPTGGSGDVEPGRSGNRGDRRTYRRPTNVQRWMKHSNRHRKP